MDVTVRLFAGLREHAGAGTVALRLGDGATVADAIAQLRDGALAGLPDNAPFVAAVAREYVREDHPLAEGDELALIPPVSGGAEMSALRYRVTAEPLDPRHVEAIVADPAAGAIVTFTGTVRDHARGRAVIALDYEAYVPAAEKMLARIGAEIATRWGITRVAIHHRTGRLPVGETSVVIAVASAHRGEAFAACQYAIERLKEIVPIWKKEFYADGVVWVGSEADYQREIGRRPAVTP